MRTQVVESGGHERHDEEGVCQQPGHQQQLLRVGQQQTHTQHQVGGEAHPVHLQHHTQSHSQAHPQKCQKYLTML